MKQAIIPSLVFSLILSALLLTPVLAQNNCASLPTRNLTVGNTGSDVSFLQQILMTDGYLHITAPTGYFGPLTKAAVASWQEASGVINPGTGYFGALSRAKLKQLNGCAVGGNLPPVLSGVAGPTTLNVGQAGTWTIQASDPENGSLNYSATWGDEPVYAVAGDGRAASAPVVWQNSTISHTYNVAGVYHPYFTVTDNTGQHVSTSITVTVGPVVVGCGSGNAFDPNTGLPCQGLHVTSPNGGENWVANSTQAIRWVWTPSPTASYSAVPKVDLYLAPEPPPCVYSNPACMIAIRAPYVLDKNIGVYATYNWIVATDVANNPIPTGQYRVQVCLAGSQTNCDSSDQPFTITGNIAQGQITVLSPNGGEVWTANSVQDIKWTNNPIPVCPSCNLSANWDKVDLYLVAENLYGPDPSCVSGATCNSGLYPVTRVLDKNISSNTAYHWIVATDIVNNPIPVGNYKVRICLAGSTTNCDSSDQPFTITPVVTTGACYVGGCSSQVCSDQPSVITTCEWRNQYACYRTAKCERQSSGQCGWTPTPQLSQCLATTP